MSVVVPAMFISFCWGVQPIIHKYLLHNISSETMMIVSSIAYFVCVLIYFLIYKTKVIKEVKRLSWKQVFWICITSIVAAFLTNIIYFKILKKHASYIVSALIYSSPVFTFLVAYMLLHEKITPYGFIGVVLMILATMFIVLHERERFVDNKMF